MPSFAPRNIQTIGASIQTNIIGTTPLLTNFTPFSLNYGFVYSGLGSQLTEFEHALKALELAAYIRYAGGPITEADLREQPIPEGMVGQISVQKVNKYTYDWHLDALVEQDGLERDEGDRAVGTLTVAAEDPERGLTNDLPAGTLVRTEKGYVQRELLVTTDVVEEYAAGGADGVLEFRTTETIPAGQLDGGRTQQVPIRAVDVGPAYNVGNASIVVMEDSRQDIAWVANDGATTGGAARESNPELRARAMAGPTFQSGGGTVSGMKGAFEAIETDERDQVTSASLTIETEDADQGTGARSPAVQAATDLERFVEDLPLIQRRALADIDRGDMKLLPVYDPEDGDYALPDTELPLSIAGGAASGVETYPDGYAYVRVIVDALEVPLEVLQAVVDSVRPVGRRHIVERPTPIEVSLTLGLRANSELVDTVSISRLLTRYLSSRELGEGITRDRLVQQVMNASDHITNIEGAIGVEKDGDPVPVPEDVDITVLERIEPGEVVVSIAEDTASGGD